MQIGKVYNQIYLFGRKSKQYDILIRKSLGTRIKRGVLYDLYEGMDILTGEIHTVYERIDHPREYVDSYRDCPDDTFEVNILFDEYEDYLKGERTIVNKKVRGLDKLHKERLSKIKKELQIQTDKTLIVGLKLHLIQKESPSMLGRSSYQEWVKNNPTQHAILKKLIYDKTNY